VFLSDIEIRNALHRGLLIEHMAPDAIGPASVDLMLSNHFWYFEDDDRTDSGLSVIRDHIDPKQDQSHVGTPIHVGDDDYLLLGPGEMVLGSTKERFVFPPYLGGRLEGKSSLGRLGLMTHVTAGFFDPGFMGYPTLEIVNLRQRPMRLYPGMPIAQMSIFQMSRVVSVPYNAKANSKYVNQGEAPAPSQYHRNFDLVKNP
jgi:dCTP deaminase